MNQRATTYLPCDPESFKTVIAPHLANKKDETFLDHFLLGNDLKNVILP